MTRSVGCLHLEHIHLELVDRCRGRWPARQVHLVPCGATVPHLAVQSRAACMDGPARVAFVGNLHYEPNLRALRYLAHRLVPHLGKRAVVDVFGRYPPLARSIAADVIVADTLSLHGPVDVLLDAPALRIDRFCRRFEQTEFVHNGGNPQVQVIEWLGRAALHTDRIKPRIRSGTTIRPPSASCSVQAGGISHALAVTITRS